MHGLLELASRCAPVNDNLRPDERQPRNDAALLRNLALLLRSWSETADEVALRHCDDAALIEALVDQIRRVAEKLDTIAWHAGLGDGPR